MNRATRVRVRQLSGLEGFSGLTRRELRAVAEAGVPRIVVPGEIVTAEDDLADGMYVVLSGTLAVERSGEALGLLGAGDLIGEIGAFGGRRTATVRATIDSELLHFTKLDLDVPGFREALEQTARKRRNRDLYTE